MPFGINFKRGKNTTMLNHVKSEGSNLRNATEKTFDGLLSLRDQLIDFNNEQGQRAAAQDLGQRQRDAAFYSKISPHLDKAFSEIIDGTVQYNVDEANWIQRGGKGALKIDAALDKTALENQQYIYTDKLQELKYKNDLEHARTVYKNAKTILAVENQLRTAFTAIDALARLDALANKPAMKQREEDVRRQEARIQERLIWGDKANDKFIPEKAYGSVKASKDVGNAMSNMLSSVAGKLGLHI